MQKPNSIDIVIPVYNEEKVLSQNLNLLKDFCNKNLNKYSWKIIIADNGSTDRTPAISKKIAANKNIIYSKIKEKGRGLALYESWSTSRSDFLSYMDVDLSSNIRDFPKLIKAIEDGNSIAIGSRLVHDSKVEGRTFTRELFSRTYNYLIRFLFHVSFHDAQCGFKILKNSVFQKIKPFIKNKNWFFDTELLIIAEKEGHKIKEVPVSWRDDPGSTVRVSMTIAEDILGLLRLFFTKPWTRK